MGHAVLIMFLAMSLIPAGDMAGKLLTGQHGVSPVFVAWSRFAMGLMAILPFVRPPALALLRDGRVWLRALLLAGGILSIQSALRTEPLANVFAAFFVGPILSYALSVLLLREPVTWTRTALMLVGFLGVLLVVRPGLGGSPGLLLALLAGCFYGAFLTASRWLSHLGTPLALSFSQLAIAGLVLTPLGLANLPALDAHTAGLTLASAMGSMLGNLLLLVAYARAPATRLAPLVYFQLIAAAGLGWAVFGDLPDLWTWAGLSLVLGAGLVSALLRR
ncbi:DMT family transporter [Ruegeria marina]|uniref:Threonine/homoserine efflux transporter RhtA n=1 Tax=Ruegeria marina TaxID=639004 RepID=A0A1G6LVT1_9RHOB|nr:DMT family transporter [Ruegeria marina]SDC47382.1 Threonine/homoserine efflux transporter RhtA [Ruegeria marina]